MTQPHRPRRTIASRRAAGRAGLRAETAAAWLLRCKGYQILQQRFRAGDGEIDLIARRGDVIAFVEVKARRQSGAAEVSITADKRRRINNAARIWLARNPAHARRSLRMDAVFVGELSLAALLRGHVRRPRHVENIAALALM